MLRADEARRPKTAAYGSCAACSLPRCGELSSSLDASRRHRSVARPARRLPALRFGALACCAGLRRRRAPRRPRARSHYAEDAKRAYDEALVAFDDQDWEDADELLNEVKSKYGYSRYARLAELRLADVDFAAGKVRRGHQGYRSFVHDYPNDPEVPYARYRIARRSSISQRRRLPAAAARGARSGDVNADAYQELSSFVNDYPRARTAPQSSTTCSRS